MQVEFPREMMGGVRGDLDRLWEDVWRIVEYLRVTEETLRGGSAETVKIDESGSTGQQASLRAARIPIGVVTSNSDTTFTADVPGVTSLDDGVCAYIRNNNAKTSTSGWTLNVNGLGAKQVYNTMENSSRVRSQFAAGYTMLFVYNANRIAGGCWDMYFGYYQDNDSVGANIRRNNGPVRSDSTVYGYKMLFTKHNGKVVPANTVGGNAPSNMGKAITTELFDPFAPIYYYYSGNSGAEGQGPSPGYTFWQYYNVDLRYSFNIDASHSPLSYPGPVYLVCDPQTDGQVKLASTPLAQALPDSEDGYVYILLGRAFGKYSIAMDGYKPVYQYKDGAVRLWTGPDTIV